MSCDALNKINHFFVKEPCWRQADRWFSGAIPRDLANWLLEPSSLTQRLKSTFEAPFSVSLIEQAWSRPLLNDARCLNHAADQYALTREVFLNIGDATAVFARSTLPKEVAFKLQGLTRLGNKPLGEIIFSYPDLQRVKLEFAKVPVSHLSSMLQKKLTGCSYIWGRRNSYQIQGGIFLVSEFFLPNVFEL